MTRLVSAVAGRAPRTRGWVLGILAVLVLVAVSAMVVAVKADTDARARASAAQEGRAVAVEVVPMLLSYDYTSAEAHFASVLDNLGGDFRGQFEDVGRTVIVPSALERKVVTTADVLESSVVSADTNEAEFLLFLNQSTTNAESPETKLDGSRVRVRVERIGERWLITELTPV